jgi:hypothetical protein
LAKPAGPNQESSNYIGKETRIKEQNPTSDKQEPLQYIRRLLEKPKGPRSYEENPHAGTKSRYHDDHRVTLH